MVKRFIHKKINDRTSSSRKPVIITSSKMKQFQPQPIVKEEKVVEKVEEVKVQEIEDVIENKEIKEEIVMNTKEKIQMAAAILNTEQPKVKKVKKDKGLIERTESSITILTEDNRELLKD